MDRKYKLYEWEKGPKVLFIPDKGVGTVYVEMIVNNCGLFTDEVVEMSHFMEHMQAKLTSVKYPCAKKIRRELEEYGCDKNAYTSDGQTNYHFTCMREYLSRILDIFLESFIHFKMDTSIFSAEKIAVITEISQNNIADIWKTFYTTIEQQLYGPRIPFAYATPEERIESTKQIQLRDLTAFRKKYYENPEMYTLVVAGDFSPSVILQEIRNKFVTPFLHQDQDQKQSAQAIPTFPLIFKDGTIIHVKNKTRLPDYKIRITWGIGNQITPSDVKQRVAIHLMSSILKKRLFEILRMREEMVYGVHVDFVPDYYGSGQFMIRTETAKKNLSRLLHVLEKEFEKLSTTIVPSKEFAGVKNKRRMLFYKDRQDTSPENFAKFYRQQVSMGKPVITNTRLYNAYMKTTSKDIMKASEMVLKCPRLIVYSG